MRFILTLFITLAYLSINAQIVKKVEGGVQPVTDTTKVLTPIGQYQDSVYVLAVLAQEKMPLRAFRYLSVTKYYIFEDSKYNKPFEQYFEEIASPLNPNPSSKRITDFKENLIWYKIIPKP